MRRIARTPGDGRPLLLAGCGTGTDFSACARFRRSSGAVGVDTALAR